MRAAVARVGLMPRQRESTRSTEPELLHGYSGLAESRLQTLPCACGGYVTADPERPAPGVAAHQFTGRHKAWRSARGDDDPGTWQES